MANVSEIINYANDSLNITKYTGFLNTESKNISIYELTKSMDLDNNKNLSSDEIYKGLLMNCSDTINSYSGLKDIFTLNIFNDTKPAEQDSIKTLEKNAQNLGIDTSELKNNINNSIGDKGINIENLEKTISSFAGVDVNEIIREASKYGLNLNLETLTINDIEDIQNRAFVVIDTLEEGANLLDEYKNGSILSALSNTPSFISKAFDLYENEPVVKNYINKLLVETKDNFMKEVNQTITKAKKKVVDGWNSACKSVENGWNTTCKTVKNWWNSIF